MSDTTKAPVENEGGFKEQVAETLEDIKEEATKLGGQLKDTAEDAWEKVKAVDVKAELKELKEDAAEVIDDLRDKAKDLWGKITGNDAEDPTQPKPQDGSLK